MDSYQSTCPHTAKEYGGFHVQSTFNYRVNQQDLVFFPCWAHEMMQRALWNFKKAKLCVSCRMTSKFDALCNGNCCGGLPRTV